jgi:hypothetical protein
VVEVILVWAKTGDDFKHPTMHRSVLTTKNYLSLTVNSDEVQRPAFNSCQLDFRNHKLLRESERYITST